MDSRLDRLLRRDVITMKTVVDYVLHKKAGVLPSMKLVFILRRLADLLILLFKLSSPN